MQLHEPLFDDVAIQQLNLLVHGPITLQDIKITLHMVTTTRSLCIPSLCLVTGKQPDQVKKPYMALSVTMLDNAPTQSWR